MKKRFRKWLIVVLSGVLICSLAIVGQTLWEYQKGNRTYRESRERFVTQVQAPEQSPDEGEPSGAGLPAKPPDPPSEPPAEVTAPDNTAPDEQQRPKVPEPSISVDFNGLEKVNGDIFAWIYIPDTLISYPLLLGVDNSKYLTHAYNGSSSKLGSIFLDKDSSPDLTGAHSIVYGHNMKNGAMFGYLKKYYGKQQAYEQHRFVYVLAPGGYVKYEVFSAYETTVTGGVYARSFADDREHQDFLDLSARSSWISSGIKPALTDKVLTLSTCAGIGDTSKRFVVQAVLREDTRNP